ncbi:pancreatic lipase-related protein 2, partial [Lingula anatina]|uniref:Pancreatic lipase-related protein 2 n=1 Tax=Lingula anatina TaxID=7574 RepID=A0A2R2ML25_LINAN
ENANVIVVDWATGAKTPNLLAAAASSNAVGSDVGWLVGTMTTMGQSPKRITLIGHSLGANVMKVAGLGLINVGNIKVGQLVALDPVAGIYTGAADLVQVIHTSSVAALAAGDIDFYINNGAIEANQVTAHMKAINIYVKSVNGGCAFKACNAAGGCNKVGYGVNAEGTKGRLDLSVPNTSTFC